MSWVSQLNFLSRLLNPRLFHLCDLLGLVYLWSHFKWSSFKHVVNGCFTCLVSRQYSFWTFAFGLFLLAILAQPLLSLLWRDREPRLLKILWLRCCQARPRRARSSLCGRRVTCEILLHLLVVRLLRRWLILDGWHSSIECVDRHHTAAPLLWFRGRILRI